LHPAKVHVMAKTRLRTDAVDARLIGIQFPRMKIEHRGLAIDGIDTPNRPARDRVGKQPEVAAAARGKILVEHPDRCDRNLEQAGSYFVRKARRIGHAVMIVTNRIHARAVSIARFGHAVERPLVSATDREARRAIAMDSMAGDVLEN